MMLGNSRKKSQNFNSETKIQSGTSLDCQFGVLRLFFLAHLENSDNKIEPLTANLMF